LNIQLHKHQTNNRQHCLKVLVLFAAIALALPLSIQTLCSSAVAQSYPFTMTIVHTNDIHAHDQPFSENGKSVGGFARIAYLIKQIKSCTPNTVAVDAGDIFQGTAFYRLYHGQVEVELLNKAGYDIYTIGNHEFDNGPLNLAAQLSRAHFTILSANLDTSAQPELSQLIKPGIIKLIGGQKVGFVGAITPELMRFCLNTDGVHPYGCQSKDTVSADWYKPIADEVHSLEAAGINKIILVSHCGLDCDRQLAHAIPSIDVIIGGHSHTRLNQPIIVAHDDGSSTYIVQTGYYGRALGKFKLCFDEQGHIIPNATNYKLIPITARIPQDPDIAAFIAAKGKPVEALEHVVLGKAQEIFSNQFQQCPNDSALGDLICDALAQSGTKYGVTISLQNRGGIRSSIQPGPITEAEIEEVLPFENTVVYATVSGKNILSVLEHAVERKTRGQFLDVHGLKFEYNPYKPPGHRINAVYVENKEGQKNPIDPSAKYKIAVNSFTFSGGEAYSFDSATDIVDSKLRSTEIVEAYIRRRHIVSPHTNGRIKAVNSRTFAYTNH
jgi:5'-nucleotidase / UDP-sugar diphosphatase